MSDVFIIDAVRTPIGAYLGNYKKTESVELGTSCLKELFDRNKTINTKEVEGLILGQVLTSGLGMNTARQVALGSGMQQTSFAYVVNQVCGSGMRATIDGSSKIYSGESNLLIVGGQESMSRARHAYLSRTGEKKLGNNIFIDTLVNDGLTDAFSKEHMGITAENVSRKYNVTRQDQDQFAYQSYLKTYKAIKNNYFKNELTKTPLKDEVRKDTTLPKLSQLKAVFKKSGIKIGIVKHAHHNFDVDVPGKDSYRFRENGADEVFVSSARRTVHIVENIDGNELTFNEVIEKIQRSKLDLVIVEGYKHEKFKKIEVYRKEVKKPMLCKNDKNIIAIISNDISNNDLQIPVFKLDDYKSIANFILKNL